MSRPPGQRSTLESGTVPQLAHPVKRSRPAHISRDTTRRHQPPRSPRRNNEARSRGPRSRADLTNLTPYQLSDALRADGIGCSRVRRERRVLVTLDTLFVTSRRWPFISANGGAVSSSAQLRQPAPRTRRAIGSTSQRRGFSSWAEPIGRRLLSPARLHQSPHSRAG